MPAPACLETLASHPLQGLSSTEAARRREGFGPNRIDSAGEPALLSRLAAPLKDVTVLLLLAAAVLAAGLGEWLDSLAIGLIVALNATVAMAQSWRADRALAALQARATVMADVIRDGQSRRLPATELVPGDLLTLEAGQQLPADVRWLGCLALQTDESALTGESVPVAKQAEPPVPENAALAERSTLGHAGTLILSGRATALVIATGLRTELGRIALMLQGTQRPPTPLQARLSRLAHQLALGIGVLCALIFVLGWVRHEPPLPLLMLAVSLAVAAIPEALPAALTLVLSMGAHRMAGSSALVRRLSAMEGLGSINVICTDKTGTLTANRMTLAAIWWDGQIQPVRTIGSGGVGAIGAIGAIGGIGAREQVGTMTDSREEAGAALLWRALALNNDASDTQGGRGDPTELALLQAVRLAGHDPLHTLARWPRIDELPFDAQRKRMSTLHQQGSHWLQITKGAPETVIPLCTRSLRADPIPAATQNPTAQTMQHRALEAAGQMAARGWRVLAIAQRAPAESALVEDDLCLLGLVALVDPPREGVREAIAACQSAGITPIMITGDHPATALAIAAELGLCNADSPALTGLQLDALDDAQLRAALASVRVFARVSPTHKLRLVEVLQASGARVAMTGDGVNDAPALQRADIGVAMGRSGTDVARQASALVLLDDHFATIVLAIREGRRIQVNLRRFLIFALSGNAIEIIAIGMAPVLGMPALLWPVQILWINLITDGLPGLALASERATPDLMTQQPGSAAMTVLDAGFWQQVGLLGACGGLAVLALQVWALAHHAEQTSTMVFTALTLVQMTAVLSLRSEHMALWRLPPWSNPMLLVTVAGSLALHAAIVHGPLLQPVFRTVALDATQWGLSGLPALAVLILIETCKCRRAIPPKRIQP